MVLLPTATQGWVGASLPLDFPPVGRTLASPCASLTGCASRVSGSSRFCVVARSYAPINCLAPPSLLFSALHITCKSVTHFLLLLFGGPTLNNTLGLQDSSCSHQVLPSTTAPLLPSSVSSSPPGCQCSFLVFIFIFSLFLFFFCRVSFSGSTCSPWVMTPQTVRLPSQLS